eukprot:1412264-Rhodomonas_salina.1
MMQLLMLPSVIDRQALTAPLLCALRACSWRAASDRSRSLEASITMPQASSGNPSRSSAYTASVQAWKQGDPSDPQLGMEQDLVSNRANERIRSWFSEAAHCKGFTDDGRAANSAVEA